MISYGLSNYFKFGLLLLVMPFIDDVLARATNTDGIVKDVLCRASNINYDEPEIKDNYIVVTSTPCFFDEDEIDTTLKYLICDSSCMHCRSHCFVNTAQCEKNEEKPCYCEIMPENETVSVTVKVLIKSTFQCLKGQLSNNFDDDKLNFTKLLQFKKDGPCSSPGIHYNEPVTKDSLIVVHSTMCVMDEIQSAVKFLICNSPCMECSPHCLINTAQCEKNEEKPCYCEIMPENERVSVTVKVLIKSTFQCLKGQFFNNFNDDKLNFTKLLEFKKDGPCSSPGIHYNEPVTKDSLIVVNSTMCVMDEIQSAVKFLICNSPCMECSPHCFVNTAQCEKNEEKLCYCEIMPEKERVSVTVKVLIKSTFQCLKGQLSNNFDDDKLNFTKLLQFKKDGPCSSPGIHYNEPVTKDSLIVVNSTMCVMDEIQSAVKFLICNSPCMECSPHCFVNTAQCEKNEEKLCYCEIMPENERVSVTVKVLIKSTFQCLKGQLFNNFNDDKLNFTKLLEFKKDGPCSSPGIHYNEPVTKDSLIVVNSTMCVMDEIQSAVKFLICSSACMECSTHCLVNISHCEENEENLCYCQSLPEKEIVSLTVKVLTKPYNQCLIGQPYNDSKLKFAKLLPITKDHCISKQKCEGQTTGKLYNISPLYCLTNIFLFLGVCCFWNHVYPLYNILASKLFAARLRQVLSSTVRNIEGDDNNGTGSESTTTNYVMGGISENVEKTIPFRKVEEQTLLSKEEYELKDTITVNPSHSG
ncbi:uncharacterized protein LOC131943838 [Physella acuta]|uniref:uncharacterized protein LOC131943838 n=1 Tax=Physella acuta TaxID=109671 RepID=UPI0027DC3102|nr:uncharacterized protein LOC131943838 [Physella acuta]